MSPSAHPLPALVLFSASSYLAARDAERVARQGLSGKVTAYREVDLIALLTGDLERSQRFVTDHLGKLATCGDDTITELRATALCYLESGSSLVKTAAALHVHRNTVLYRLGSIERILGLELAASPLSPRTPLSLSRSCSGPLPSSTGTSHHDRPSTGPVSRTPRTSRRVLV